MTSGGDTGRDEALLDLNRRDIQLDRRQVVVAQRREDAGASSLQAASAIGSSSAWRRVRCRICGKVDCPVVAHSGRGFGRDLAVDVAAGEAEVMVAELAGHDDVAVDRHVVQVVERKPLKDAGQPSTGAAAAE